MSETANEKIGKIRVIPRRGRGDRDGINKRGIVGRKIALRGCQVRIRKSTATNGNLP